MSDMPNAPLEAGLAFNMAPGDVQIPTAPTQPAAVLSEPLQESAAAPTQPQIPLHDKRPQKNKSDPDLEPNREQIYHIRGTSKFLSLNNLKICSKDAPGTPIL